MPILHPSFPITWYTIYIYLELVILTSNAFYFSKKNQSNATNNYDDNSLHTAPQKNWYTVRYSNPQLSKPSNIHPSCSILPPLCLVVMMGIIISMMKMIPVFR